MGCFLLGSYSVACSQLGCLQEEGPPLTVPILTRAARQTQQESRHWELLFSSFSDSGCVVIQEVLNSLKLVPISI